MDHMYINQGCGVGVRAFFSGVRVGVEDLIPTPTPAV